MDKLIDRVARAIYEGRNGRGCKPWSLQTKAHKAPYLEDARAVFEVVADDLGKQADEGYPAAWAEEHVREALSTPLSAGRAS
jgi:hypothetical protein